MTAKASLFELIREHFQHRIQKKPGVIRLDTFVSLRPFDSSLDKFFDADVGYCLKD